MTSTAQFEIMKSYWFNMTDHFGFYSAMSFVGSLFGYMLGVENYELLFVLLIVVWLDTFIGMMKALKQKNFNAKGIGRILVKVPLYAVFIISFHICVIIIDGHFGFDPKFIDIMAYLLLILRELKSISEKLAFFGLNTPLPFVLIESKINYYQQLIEKGKGRREEDHQA